MRVIVTGPRGWKGKAYFQALLKAMTEVRSSYNVPPDDPITLVEGEAQGFDLMAKSIAESLGWTIEEFPADWYPSGTYNPEAGHARNQDMVNSGGDIALAGLMWCVKPEHKGQKLHYTHGTADCIGRLEDAGIPIEYVSIYGLSPADEMEVD